MTYDLVLGVLNGLNQLTTISKTLSDQKVAAAINAAVVDINTKLILAQQQMIEIQQENQNLRDQLRELADTKALEASIFLLYGAIWKKRIDDTQDGPYCPSCWGLEKKLVYLAVGDRRREPVQLMCSHHGGIEVFYVPGHLIPHLLGS